MAKSAAAQSASAVSSDTKTITVNQGEFVRTRDALVTTLLGLSTQLDRVTRAYLDHTQVVLDGGATLNPGLLLQPLNDLGGQTKALTQQLGSTGGAALSPNEDSAAAAAATTTSTIIAPAAAAAAAESEEKKKRAKRSYKARDPNAPKRPLTAYFRYLGENRAQIAAEVAQNPDSFAAAGKPGDISRIATERWNALTKDQQEPYRKAYQDDLKKYEDSVAKYKAAGGGPPDIPISPTLNSSTVAAVMAGVVDDDDDADADEDSSDDEKEIMKKPPPPPPAKKTPKSALKKSAPAPSAQVSSLSHATPKFSAVNSVQPAAVAETPKASSPELKRKAAGDGEGTKTKKPRKSKADVAAEKEKALSTPAAVETPADTASAKKKKERKKKKGSE